MSAWNDFVKKIYWEGKKSNPNYKFKEALKDASKRKGEMGIAMGTSKTTKSKTAMKKSKNGGRRKGKGTRKNR